MGVASHTAVKKVIDFPPPVIEASSHQDPVQHTQLSAAQCAENRPIKYHLSVSAHHVVITNLHNWLCVCREQRDKKKKLGKLSLTAAGVQMEKKSNFVKICYKTESRVL